MHLIAAGQDRAGLDLVEARTAEECFALVDEFRPLDATWITGGGWSLSLSLSEGGTPTAAQLDAITDLHCSSTPIDTAPG